ncbi:MAG TPA: response regulator [Verrucomicrobiae bacterium]|nr:response regulator [Verrucomicrobiae bacterium]
MDYSSYRIIIVDDEYEIAFILQQYLDKMGMNAKHFTDPVLALDYFKLNPKYYSMVITDLRMPGMSGLQLAHKIRRINNTIKIILITAFEICDLENNLEFSESKIDSIVQKPVKLPIFKDMIINILNDDKRKNIAI